MHKKIIFFRFTNVLVALTLLIALVATTVGWYQPSTKTTAGEQTARFLPENTNAYFSFNLQPGYIQSYQFTYFLSFFKDAFLASVNESNHLAYDFLNDRNFASIAGPELAMATFNYNGSDGLVFFIQIPAGVDAAELRDDVIALINASLEGYQSENTIDGVIEINRLVDGVYKNEYYVNTGVNGGTDQYVIGAWGNISIYDFQTLNSSVLNGTWPSANLSANASFQDIQNHLPTQTSHSRMGLGYMNKANLKINAANTASAIQPYLTALEEQIPYISTLNDILPYLISIYDTIDPYIPGYAGASISSVSNGLQIDSYSPDNILPISAGVNNSLSTAAFIPSNAYTYVSDTDLNAWWQELRPIIEDHAVGLASICDYLDGYGFNFTKLLAAASNASLDEDVFNWTTGDFAWALVPYNGTGNLMVFNVTDPVEAAIHVIDLHDALEYAGFEDVEYQFTAGNATLLLGWPTGVISASQSGTKLQTVVSYRSMLTSYLSSPVRGLFYADLPAPLVDMGASYHMGSFTGRIVLRVPQPSVSGGGGGGGGGGQASIQVRFWDALGNPIKGSINSKGMLLQNISAKSKDGAVTLNISKGTTFLTCANKVFTEILINPGNASLPNASGYSIVKAYEFKPNCAVFNKSVTITMAYNTSALPAGFNESKLAVAFYNTNASKWDLISGTVNSTAHKITFSINHFTTFAILAPDAATPTPTTPPTITPTPTPTTSGGGLGAGAWAGIGIAIAVVLAIIIYLILLKIYPPVKREE